MLENLLAIANFYVIKNFESIFKQKFSFLLMLIFSQYLKQTTFQLIKVNWKNSEAFNRYYSLCINGTLFWADKDCTSANA